MVVLAVIKGGNSPYHSTRLFEALKLLNSKCEELAVKPKQSPIPELSQFAGPAAAAKKTKPDFHSLPEAMKDVTTLKNQHKRRADQLFIEISFTESQELRREMATTMLDDYEKVQECWALLDNYRETGIVLNNKKATIEQEVDGMTTMERFNNFKNIRTYLTKDKKKAANMEPGRQLTKVLARIQENQLKLKLIEDSLKNGVV